MQKYKLIILSFCYFLLTFCFFPSVFGQITIEPIVNPLQIIPMQNTEFSVTVTNNSVSGYNNLTLEAVGSSGFTVTPVTTNAIPALSANSSVTIKFNVFPTCSAPQSGGILTFTLKNSGGTTLQQLSTNKINLEIPHFLFSPPANAEVSWVSGTQEYTRVWSISNTTPVPVNFLRVVNTCNKTKFVITKIELLGNAGGSTILDATGILDVAQTNTYIYNFDLGVFSQIGNNNNTLDENEVIYIRETYKVIGCGDVSTTYTWGYGNSTTVCFSNSNAASFVSVKAPSYGPDIYSIERLYPTSSTNTGKLRIGIANTVGTPQDALHDVLVRIWWADLLRFTVKSVYFSTGASNGAPHPTAPPVQWTNNTAISPIAYSMTGNINLANLMAWVVNFDNLNNPANKTLYESLGLCDANGDGVWNDIAPGKTVYLTIEYDFDPWKYQECEANGFFCSNGYGFATLFYKNNCGNYESFSQPNNNSTTTTHYQYGVLRFEEPQPSTITPINLKPGDEVSFKVPETMNNIGNAGYMSNLPGIDHYISITLPDGFEYDTSKEGVIITSGAAEFSCNTAHVTKKVVAGRDVITILNKYTNCNTTNKSYIITMKAKSGITAAAAKDYSIEHGWAFQGETTKIFRYGCYSNLPVNYKLIVPFQNMALEEFDVKRMTFGWNKYTEPRTKITLTNIHLFPKVDRTVAGPYDDVDISGTVYIATGFTVNATDKWYVDMGYDGLANPYFVFPTPQNAVEVQLNGTVVKNIPESAVIVKNDPVSGGKKYTLRVDLTPYTISGQPLANLKNGDLVTVTYKMRTENNLGRPLKAVPNFFLQTYLDINSAGAPQGKNILANSFRIVDYKPGEMIGRSFLFNENNNPANSFYALRMSTQYANMIASEHVFVNEYRPNLLLNKSVITIDNEVNISKVEGYRIVIGESVPMVVQLNNPTDYQVTHSGGKTIIEITKLFECETVNSLYSVRYTVWTEDVCPNNNSFVTTLHITHYPTSEEPKEEIFNTVKTTGYSVLNRYELGLTSPVPVNFPETEHAAWNITLQNKSIWRNTDPVLPNCWIALEFPVSAVSSENLTVKSGDGMTTYDILPYAAGKVWVKLGDVSVLHTKDFQILCDGFTSCTPFQIKTTFGVCKFGYPNHPDDNSFKGCPVKVTQTLEARPVSHRLYGELIDPVSDYEITPGRYTFCNPHKFTAIFSNVDVSNLYNPVFQIYLNKGFELIESSIKASINTATPTVVSVVEIDCIDEDNGTPVALSNTDVKRLVTIKFAPGTLLTKLGDPGSQMTITFDLKPVCGFTSGSQLYVSFLSDDGCSGLSGETKNGAPFYIDGEPVTSNFSISDFEYSGTLDLSSATSIAASSVNVTATITVTAPQGGFDNRIALSVPPNMTLVNNPGSEVFSLPVGETNLYYAKIPAGLGISQTCRVDVTLKPINPGNWNCGNATLTIYTFAMLQITCVAENKTCDLPEKHENDRDFSIPVTKNDISFISAKAEGSYSSATTESVVFTGSLAVQENSNLGNITVEVYSGETALGISFVINNVVTEAGQNEFPFVSIPLNIPAAEMCKLQLKILRDAHPYLCKDASAIISQPYYRFINQGPFNICVNDELSVGDIDPITGYSYTWNPATYIQGAPNLSQATVKFPAPVKGYDLVCKIERLGCMTETTVRINATQVASQYHLMLNDTTVCEGDKAKLRPEAFGIEHPVFYWYDSQTEETPFHTGDEYETTGITVPVTLFVSVKGDNHCENKPGNRLQVIITSEECCEKPELTPIDKCE